MPELPDVETFRRYLDSVALHQRIATASVREKRVLRDVSASTLRRRLRGARLIDTVRRGKLLFAATDVGPWLLLHFGMTGYLRYHRGPDGPHDRVVLRFDNGYSLAYVNSRMFGYVSLCDDPDEVIEARPLGPDALDVDAPKLRELLAGRSGSIKAALMDQSLIAGIGNVYSDEILYQARVHPARPVSELSPREVGRVATKLHSVLQRAIEAKADPSAMPRTWLTPHRVRGEQCPRCGATLEQIEIHQRTAYLCPKCQGRGRPYSSVGRTTASSSARRGA